ncbi:MAG: EamA family transporter, partial [Pseudomonadota bacterium]
SGKESPIRILLINNLIGSLVSIPLIWLVWIPPTIIQWLMLLAIGAIMVTAQYLNILAMQRADASFVAPFWLITPFFACVFDFTIFNTVVSSLTAMGMLLILVGGWMVYRSG